MTPDEMAAELLRLVNEAEDTLDDEHADRQLLLEHLIRDIRRVLKPEPERLANVILFKPSGKYYTVETWRVPRKAWDYSPQRGDFVREVIGPYDMDQSPDFRRIDGGAVLVPSQEPWGYPHLFPPES